MLNPLSISASPTVAIVGGGFSGIMVATQLMHQATAPLRIHLIERRSRLGGIAYNTAYDCHLLNVPAGKISAFPDQPDHFLDWLQQQPGFAAATANMFISRQLYGQYLQAILAEAQTLANVQFEHWQDEVEAVHPTSAGAMVCLQSGQLLSVDCVVLALGNLPPVEPAVADPAFYSSSRYIGNSWSSEAMSAVDFAQPVLLIGSGLTMVDWALALHQHQFCYPIHVISRHGLLPQSHVKPPVEPHVCAPSPSHSPYSLSCPPPTGRKLLHWLRQEIEFAEQQGHRWQTVIDALRPHTQTLWQSLPLGEKQRFLRHLRPYWEVHRHRIAPEAKDVIEQLRQTGQLQLRAGRIQSYREQGQKIEVRLHLRGQTSICLSVGTVVNCTGAASDYRRCNQPLMLSLLQTGLAIPDPLGLGLATAANGALIQANGQAADWLFTLGSPQKGKLWETTAVPELRQQTKALAETLLHHQLSVSDSYQISKSKSLRYSRAL